MCAMPCTTRPPCWSIICILPRQWLPYATTSSGKQTLPLFSWLLPPAGLRLFLHNSLFLFIDYAALLCAGLLFILIELS